MLKIRTTIGLSLSTRSMGVAVFRGAELVDWEVQHFKGYWSEEKANRITVAVRSVIRRYSPTLVAVKSSRLSNACDHVRGLIDQVCHIITDIKVDLRVLTLYDLKKFPGFGKCALVDALSDKFPVLSQYNKNRLQFLSGYYLKLFEAVAVAYECV